MLEKENKPGDITFLDFKPYYEATVIKIVWCWQIDTHRAMDRKESPEINPYSYG